ncbi:MAG: prolyl oligopeptidase family serine peptidase [Rhodopirellula sp.]|nr:prolyl oligopeptidase family serine peptidase [Rhodopirellula sp.]
MLDRQHGHESPAWADAAIFTKGLTWALKYDREFSPAQTQLLDRAVTRSQERLAALTAGTSAWKDRRGKLALGYVSRVDGSVQPYGVIVPRNYDPSESIRLDVVLHGSTRPVGISELKFIARFDTGDGETSPVPEQSFIELHPLGRVENCYRWSGETDVFEAIEDVCRRYNIDRNRIVLRGMSMGASGTWHLGLKYPDRFVALGPYCGYVDTHRFSETPLKNFIRVGPLPDYQERGLHMLDSVDYAANAGVVPAIACIGEKDVFFQAHVIMGEAMRREGLKMVNLISPGTGHVIDPVTHAEQMKRIAQYVAAAPRRPRELRFVTWTLKYNRCHWLEVLQLEQHYVRAELSAKLADGVLVVAEPQNITRFAIRSNELPERPRRIRIGASASEFPFPDGRVELEHIDGKWQLMDEGSHSKVSGKRPGLQGPIDDAFTTPFLCVRGTGQPWNADMQKYAEASLRRFAEEWHHYFRGELPIKNDVDVTEDDIRTRNLILFGDPGSNKWIAETLPHLPLSWSRDLLHMGGQDYSAADHVPAFITPNPLPGAGERYVVLNSGHTFRETELASLNYLLFPRWGDWAVLKPVLPVNESMPVTEQVLRAGYFDEQWRFSRTSSSR